MHGPYTRKIIHIVPRASGHMQIPAKFSGLKARFGYLVFGGGVCFFFVCFFGLWPSEIVFQLIAREREKIKEMI